MKKQTDLETVKELLNKINMEYVVEYRDNCIELCAMNDWSVGNRTPKRVDFTFDNHGNAIALEGKGTK